MSALERNAGSGSLPAGSLSFQTFIISKNRRKGKKIMSKKVIAAAVAAAVGGMGAMGSAQANGVMYKDGDKYLKIGGRIQMQYYQVDPDNGDSADKLFFRRLRPFIEGSLYPHWKGKFQFDLGKASGGNEVSLKDAYFQYKGFQAFNIAFGNKGFPFSREYVTSSKYQQFVERTFVGDASYGTPEWNFGIHLDGKSGNLTWAAAFVQADLDPDNGKLDFDTPVNKDPDFNQGWMVGGRVDYHPFGILKFSQGDFEGVQKATIGVSAYTWRNDDDVENVVKTSTLTIDTDDPACLAACPVTETVTTSPSTEDVDSVTAFEISGAYRNKGLSIDAQYNQIQSELKASGVTDGLYKDSETTLDQWMIKGGYMIVPRTLELVGGYQSQDADNYAEPWTRVSLGANWYIQKHHIKYQLTYRQNSDAQGVKGNDVNELFVQAQFVF